MHALYVTPVNISMFCVLLV